MCICIHTYTYVALKHTLQLHICICFQTGVGLVPLILFPTNDTGQRQGGERPVLKKAAINAPKTVAHALRLPIPSAKI